MEGIEHASFGMLLFMAFSAIVFFVSLRRAERGADIPVRRIPGVDAIDEAVGRAAEMGRPTVFSTGLTDVGPVLYACLGVLHYIAQKIARFKTRLFVPQYAPEAMAVVEDTVRDAYRVAGRPQSFDPQSIMFLSSEQFAFASGYMGLVHRERAASCFLFGQFAAESLILAEAGQQVGAMQVGASVSPEQVAFFVCTCDYTLIGEELFAASAYVTREPVQLSSLRSQDVVKLVVFAIVVVGVLLVTAMQFPAASDTVKPVLNVGSRVEAAYQSLWLEVIQLFKR